MIKVFIISFLLISNLSLAAITDSVINIIVNDKISEDILYFIKDDVEKQGFKLKISLIKNKSQINKMVDNGEVDANFFQSKEYLNLDEDKNMFQNLEDSDGVVFYPYALYSNNSNSIDKIMDNSIVGVSGDPVNMGRAMLLLQSAGIIELDSRSDIFYTKNNILRNDKNIIIQEIFDEQLEKSFKKNNVDMVIMPIYINKSLEPIYIETINKQAFTRIIVFYKNINNKKVDAIMNTITSKKTSDYIRNKYENLQIIPIYN